MKFCYRQGLWTGWSSAKIKLYQKYKSSKPPWDSVSHPLKWLLWKKITSVGKDVQKSEPFAPLVEMRNSAFAMENSVEFP